MLRNLVSENRQLRDQNMFLRNLYDNRNLACNPMEPLQQPSVYHQKKSQVLYFAETASNKLDPSLTSILKNETEKFDFASVSDPLNNNSMKVTDMITDISLTVSETEKKLLKKPSNPTSPKRISRSSVITQNYSIMQNPYPSYESPTRRSARLMEKEKNLITPPSSRDNSFTALLEDKSQMDLLQSPTTRSRSLLLEQMKKEQFATPEKIRGIPPRSAKRSLDAIIEAIDHLEKS